MRLVIAAGVALVLTGWPGSAEAKRPPRGEAERVASFLTPGTTGHGGTTAVYLRRTGRSHPLLALNASFAIEPASAIKMLLHLHAMRLVRPGNESLDSPLQVWKYTLSAGTLGDPSSPGACPNEVEEGNPLNAETLPLGEGMRLMMVESNNRTTRGIVLRYGLPALNATAAAIGMTHTRLGQDLIGCFYFGDKHNETTLEDLARLYEGVERTRFVDATGRSLMYERMLAGSGPPYPEVERVVRDVGEAVNARPGAVEKVLAGMRFAQKPGFYTIPCAAVPYAGERMANECGSPSRSAFVTSLAGTVTVPFARRPRTYVGGVALHERFDDCANCVPQYRAALLRAYAERLRWVIRQALRSYR